MLESSGGKTVTRTFKTFATLAFLIALSAAVAGARPHARRGGRGGIGARALQLIVVSSPSADAQFATVRTYRRSAPGGVWHRVFASWPAEIGYDGLRANRHEGDGTTPIGMFRIGRTIYGNRPDPGGLRYRYHRLVCGDWWDEDEFSSRYNRFVHAPCGSTPAFAPRSEALWRSTVAYSYFAVVEFNTRPVRGGADAPGSGIFLHAWVGGPTAGCVALHEAQLLELLRWLRPSADPMIAIGVDAHPG